MMKKSILIPVILAFIILATSHKVFAQDKAGFSEVFEEYAQRDNTISFTFTKELLDAVDIDVEWEEKIRNVSGDIYRMRFIAFDKKDECNKILSHLDQEIKRLGYPAIPYNFNYSSDTHQFRMYGKKNNNYYRQVHLLIKDDDGRAFLISVDGKLKVIQEA